MTAPVDVDATLAALELLAANRLRAMRHEFDKERRRGRRPHPETTVKAERAEYLRDQARATRKAFALLIEAAYEANLLLEIVAGIHPSDEPQEGSTGHKLRTALAACGRRP